ncbi:MAG: hypothetical protein LUC50_08330 [Ruminococcus sp.]|nr:hypothetical protein [Ruminococcus sp.]
MAQYSRQEQNPMQREAQRRAEEMQQRVHPTIPRNRRQYADNPPKPLNRETLPPKNPEGIPLLQDLLSNPASVFSKLDSDSMLILALMAILYKEGVKDGCDKKLLMALAYLLT